MLLNFWTLFSNLLLKSIRLSVKSILKLTIMNPSISNYKKDFKSIFSINDLKQETIKFFPEAEVEIQKVKSSNLNLLSFLYCFLLDKSSPTKNPDYSLKFIAEEMQENLLIKIEVLNYNLN